MKCKPGAAFLLCMTGSQKWTKMKLTSTELERERVQHKTVRKRHTQGTTSSLRTSESYLFPTYALSSPSSFRILAHSKDMSSDFIKPIPPYGYHPLNPSHPPSLTWLPPTQPQSSPLSDISSWLSASEPPRLVTIQHSGLPCLSHH